MRTIISLGVAAVVAATLMLAPSEGPKTTWVSMGTVEVQANHNTPARAQWLCDAYIDADANWVEVDHSQCWFRIYSQVEDSNIRWVRYCMDWYNRDIEYGERECWRSVSEDPGGLQEINRVKDFWTGTGVISGRIVGGKAKYKGGPYDDLIGPVKPTIPKLWYAGEHRPPNSDSPQVTDLYSHCTAEYPCEADVRANIPVHYNGANNPDWYAEDGPLYKATCTQTDSVEIEKVIVTNKHWKFRVRNAGFGWSNSWRHVYVPSGEGFTFTNASKPDPCTIYFQASA